MDSENENRRRQFRIVIALSVAAVIGAVIVYAPVFRGDFIFDDIIEIVRNYRANAGFWETVFDKPFRSVPASIQLVISRIFSLNPFALHLAGFIAHVLVSGLVGAFWRRATLWATDGDRSAARWTGFIAGAVFLSHPLNVEATAYVTAFSDVLCSGLVFAGLYFALRAFEKGFVLKWYIASMASLILALFCKETGAQGFIIHWALITLLTGAALEREAVPGGRILRYRSAFFVLSAVILFFWGLFRFSDRIDLGLRAGEKLSRLWTTPFWELGMYARLALLPFGLCLDHGGFPDKTFGDPIIQALGLVTAIIGSVGFLMIFLRLERVTKLIALASLWWLTGLALSVLAPLADAVAERRAYMAMGAFAGMAGLLFAKARGNSGFGGKTAILTIVVMLISYNLLSAQYAAKWSSPEKLWASSTRVNPDSDRAWEWLGKIWFKRGNLSGAKLAFETQARLKPRCSTAQGFLGMIADAEGRVEDAAKHFEKALQLDPGDQLVRVRWGKLEIKRGDYRKAAELLKGAGHAP